MIPGGEACEAPDPSGRFTLDEGFFGASDPAGRFTLDEGFFGASDPAGCFTLDEGFFGASDPAGCFTLDEGFSMLRIRPYGLDDRLLMILIRLAASEREGNRSVLIMEQRTAGTAEVPAALIIQDI